jgi:23S rRNA G2445 N2-methylase RlmL
MADAARHYFLTVPTGFEFIARQELSEAIAFGAGADRRGKLEIKTAAPVERLLSLRSCFHVFAHLTTQDEVPSDEAGLEWLKALPGQIDWREAMETWAGCFNRSDEPRSFRITAQRSGTHAFGSPDVAAALGAGVQHHFGWPVDLKSPDIEIYAHLREHELLLGITLTSQSLHLTEGLERGRTGLKQPIAHGLARLINSQPGEVTLDPMCGVGTLPLEAAVLQSRALHLGGDKDWPELERAARNRTRTNTQFDLAQWDARRLPLADETIDALVCDLPFGVRVGSHRRNVHLYPPVFAEMARVLKPGGRAVLLSLERRLVERRVDKDLRWRIQQRFPIHFGGLDPTVFQLTRV